MDLRREGFLTDGANVASEWTPVQLCQAVAEVHYAMSSRDDGLAHYRHPLYMAISAALDTAIATAYPQTVETLGADFIRTVRAIYADCQEPIAYCVERATDHLVERERMAAEALREGRVGQYVNAAALDQSGYWAKHLAGYYRIDQLTMPYGVSNLLHSILAGEARCLCGSDHAGDRRAAEQYEGPDASREDTPRAQGEAGGLSTSVDQPTSDRAPLRHERTPTRYGPIDKAAILRRTIDSLVDSGAEAPTPAGDEQTVRILRDLAAKATDPTTKAEYVAAADAIEREHQS